MRFTNTMLSVIFFLALAGCASKNDLDYLRFDMEELKARLPKVEQELGTLRSETKEGLDKNLKGLQTDMESMRRGAADLQANIEAMKVDLQVQSGKLDDAALAAKKPVDDLTLLRDDMERRFAALDGRMLKLEKGQEEQKISVETPEALYHKGLDTFRSGNPQKARESLARFLQLYPSHELAANAHYWLGETYYDEKKFDQAVLEFQEVIKNFPGKEKVPASMLKQAMAFKELGDLKSTRYLYKKLIEEFPSSAEAKTAKENLKGIK
jgi:tol-pal system protein YbgF